MDHPSWLTGTQIWPVYVVTTVALLAVTAGCDQMLRDGDTSDRRRAFDDRLRCSLPRNPAPAPVCTVIADAAGHYKDGSGCAWDRNTAPRHLVARRTSRTLEDWTHSMGGVGASTRGPGDISVNLVRMLAHCTAAFDDGVDATLEVAVLAGLDPDRSKTPIAASAVAELIR